MHIEDGVRDKSAVKSREIQINYRVERFWSLNLFIFKFNRP